MTKKTLFFLVLGLLFMSNFSYVAAQTDASLPDPGLTPDNPFYFLDDFWKSVRLTFAFGVEKKADLRIKFAEEKLAEANEMARANNPNAVRRALNRYREQLGENGDQLNDLIGEERAAVAERVADATSRHLEILDRVQERVPEQARDAVLSAKESSENGHLTALRALSVDKIEKAATLTKEALDRRVEIVQRKADENEDEDIGRDVNRLNRFAEFAEELQSRAQDNPELRERIRARLEDGLLHREEVLIRVLEEAPEEAKPALERALEQNRRIEAPRPIEIIDVLNRTGTNTGESELRERRGDRICIQIITRAQNPENGVIRQFATPCDVPDGWIELPGAEKPDVEKYLLPQNSDLDFETEDTMPEAESPEDVFSPLQRPLQDLVR